MCRPSETALRGCLTLTELAAVTHQLRPPRNASSGVFVPARLMLDAAYLRFGVGGPGRAPSDGAAEIYTVVSSAATLDALKRLGKTLER
jgi:hypothetical protein